jgi:putative sigma-54 modulation protein
MDIVIRSRNVEVPEPVRAAVREKLPRLARFFDGIDHAEVLFAAERNPRIAERETCEVTIGGHGHLVRAKAAGVDQFAALDRVLDRLEQRIVRLKGRLLGRSHPRRHGPLDSTRSGQGPTMTGVVPSEPEESPESPALRIVKTKRFPIKPMTAEEAVLQMELLGHDFYVFTNAETQQAAVVYRRRDGQVGLIEAQ